MVSAPLGATALSTGTLAELVEEGENVEVDAGLGCGGLQMLDAVDRSAHRQHRGRGVAERAGRQNLRGFRSSHTISTMRRPERRARSNIFGLFASTGARRAASCRAPRRRCASSWRCPCRRTRPAR